MIPFGIRGVLWDQGESGTAVFGVDQYTLMGALIRGWRKEWGQGDFPFLYVQKPSGEGCAWDPEDPVTNKANKFAPLPAAVPATASGVYRETHVRIAQYPGTAMVISTDLGSGIHPTNKSGYGSRAARVALGMVYGRKIEYYGPVYASHKVEGNKVRVSFTHVGAGLAFKHGDKLQGFAVAGEDKVFHWADAVIDGDTVVVTSDKVAKPVAVRYAWADKHPWANLFNKDGLPAQTFRTDGW
jgi:sialate O-acetylesterase